MGILPFGTVRPNERGLVERFGKYHSFKNPGFTWLIPLVDDLIKVNITEQMVEVQRQEIITQDSLNATVDAQIYFKVVATEDGVKRSEYEVANYIIQIVSLARTTLRSIIGTMTLSDANSERNKINQELAEAMETQTQAWGIQIVRAELKEIQAPPEVQAVMNQVVEAEKKMIASKNLATAVETEADGKRRAEIKLAEGQKQAAILQAEGQAEQIKKIANARAEQIRIESQAAQEFFKAGAVDLKRLQVAEVALKDNMKVIVSEGTSLVNVVSDAAGKIVVPVAPKEVKKSA